MLNGDVSLTTLAFPALTSANDVYIEDDPSLSQCAAASFAAGLGGNGTRTISGNGPC